MYGSSGLVLHVTLISGRVLRKFKSGVRKHWTEQDEYGKMDAQEVQEYFIAFAKAVSSQFEKIPGSAILARYIKSSYQNDPVRSAVELFLVLFAVRYLLAPKYSTKPNYVKLSEEVVPTAYSER
jgi:hypothetical protein